jgi:DNA-binding NtrC family response regulator
LDYAPRILIVDDEQSVRAFFDQVLSEDGYHIAAVGTARHALLMMGDHEFEAVVVDLSLSDRDGLDLIRQMRHEMPYLKILATSGFLVGDMPTVAIQAGATATLAKPTTAWRLRDAVYRLLEPSGRWRGAGK